MKPLLAVLAWTTAVLVMTLAGWTSYQQGTHTYAGEPSLPVPAPRLSPSPQELSVITATAIQQAGRAAIVYNIRLDRSDVKRFQGHFVNVAMQRGWFPHNLRSRSIEVVLPAAELHDLQSITGDPVDWVLANAQPTADSRGPSDLNVVNAQVAIDIPSSAAWSGYILAAVAAWMIAFGLAFAGGWIIAEKTVSKLRHQ